MTPEKSTETEHFMASQQALQTEVEKLRLLHPDTQALYQEVCMLMFFRFGITPTSNKMYQLVRKGSMSAPAEALNRFWQNLRDKSRVRIEHADLPEPLRESAGQLIAELWKKSQQEAQQLQAVFRSECESSVQQATLATQACLGKIGELEMAQSQLQSALDMQTEQTQSAELALAGAKAEAKQTISDLQGQLHTHISERLQLQENINQLHQQHAQELEKQRQQTESVQQQHAEDIRRLLLEVDRERLAAARVQKSIDQLQRLQTEQSALHRTESDALALGLSQSQAATESAMRKVSSLEGTVTELRQQLLASSQAHQAGRTLPAIQQLPLAKGAGRAALRPPRTSPKQMLRKPNAVHKNKLVRVQQG